jgi:hypothetical protein
MTCLDSISPSSAGFCSLCCWGPEPQAVRVCAMGWAPRGGDKLSGRNINVSFINNSNVPIEVMIFIFYSDEIAIDVTTGLVTRHKN